MILIPTFNAENLIEKTIRSALNHYNNVVVIDNCSTDETVKIANRFSVRVIINTSNLGRIGNWNKAIEVARAEGAEWFKLLFAGDEITNLNIEEIHQTFSRDMIACIFTNYTISNNGLVKTRSIFPTHTILSPENYIDVNLKLGNVYGPPSAYIFKTQYINICFKESLPWSADWRFMTDLNEKYFLYYNKSVGCNFSVESRRFFSEQKVSLLSLKEEISQVTHLLSKSKYKKRYLQNYCKFTIDKIYKFCKKSVKKQCL